MNVIDMFILLRFDSSTNCSLPLFICFIRNILIILLMRITVALFDSIFSFILFVTCIIPIKLKLNPCTYTLLQNVISKVIAAICTNV